LELRPSRKWIPVPGIAVVVGLALVVVSGMKVSRLDPVRVPDSPAFPDPKIMGAFSAGYGGFAASSMWIEVVMDYADILFDNKSMATFPAEIEAVTVLDPHWQYPFEFAGLVLDDGVPAHKTRAIRLLRKGVDNFPRSWKLRLYLAMLLQEGGAVQADSAASILMPVATDTASPLFARTLAFTLLHKSGRPEEAMSLLLQTYEQVPDPMVRLQFRDKIADLLRRNEVSLGAESEDFMGGIGSLLESKDPGDHSAAGRLLIGLVDTARREATLVPARQLAGQFRTFRTGVAK